MPHGNSIQRYEEPAVAPPEAVYSTVTPAVADTYNELLLAHLRSFDLTRGGRFGGTGNPSEPYPDSTYPKLIGDKVFLLSFDGTASTEVKPNGARRTSLSASLPTTPSFDDDLYRPELSGRTRVWGQRSTRTSTGRFFNHWDD